MRVKDIDAVFKASFGVASEAPILRVPDPPVLQGPGREAVVARMGRHGPALLPAPLEQTVRLPP